MIRRLALTLAAATAAVLLPASVATAGTDPGALPEGDPPAVTWQSGATVHLPSGKTISLPLGKAGAGYQVLGRRRGEWIVVVPGYDAKVLAVRGTKVRTVWKHVYDEAATDYYLARGGTRVAEVNYDRSGSTEIVVFDLHGKVVAQRSWAGGVSMLDFTGDTLLLSGRKATSRWALPGKPVPVGPEASYADPAGDLLFVDVSDDTVGLTSLSAPGTPTWTADDFIPLSVSPDAAYVAGLDYTHKLKLVVRRMTDGAVQPLPAFRAGFETALAWEADGALLLSAKSSSGQLLVRCTVTGTVTGTCERATDGVKGQTLGFPG